MPKSMPKPLALRNRKALIFVGTGFILFFIAWLKLLGKPADYQAYVNTITDPTFRTGTEEVSYQLFLHLTNLLTPHSTYLFFFFYAAFGVFIKLYAILKKSKLPFYTLLLYIPSYFLLHEYVQIRASISIGIFILAIDDITNGKLWNYLFKMGLAVFFHWSAAIMLPVYFVVRSLNWKYAIALPFLGLTLNFIRFIPNLPVFDAGIIGMLYSYYTLHSGQTEFINVLNTITLIQLLIFLVIAFYLQQFERRHTLDNQILTMFNIYSISMFTFFLFSSMELPVIAFRLNEFLNITLFFLIPAVISKDHQKTLPALLGVFYFSLYSANLILNTGVIPDLKFFRIF